MKTASIAIACLALAVCLPVLPAGPAAHASTVSCCSHPVHWADRHDLDEARIAITTEDGDVTLLLTPRVVAIQLSERTLHKVDREMRKHEDDQDNPIAQAIQTAVFTTVRQVLDHSFECPVRELRDVSYRNGRLVLTTRDGEEIFGDIEIRDSQIMESFSEHDARDFVREFQRLKTRGR